MPPTYAHRSSGPGRALVRADPVVLLAAVREGYRSLLVDAGLPQHRLGGPTPAAATSLLDASAPQLSPMIRDRLLKEAAGCTLEPDLLEPAAEAAIIDVDLDCVRFRHPLIRLAVRQSAGVLRRRRVLKSAFSKPMPDRKGGTIAPAGKAFAVDMLPVGTWNRQGAMDEEFLFWDNQTFYGEMGVA